MATYEALGDEEAVAEAVERFYQKLKSDPAVAVFFEKTDLDTLKVRQRMFLTAALGGPDAYEGRDMRAAHAHLRVTDADFDVFLERLAETLTELSVAPERVAEVLDALAPLRLEIVHAEGEDADRLGASDPTGGSG